MRLFEDIEVVGLGHACFDSLGRVPSYPHESGKMEWLDLQSQCGGPASKRKSTAAFNHRFFSYADALRFSPSISRHQPF